MEIAMLDGALQAARESITSASAGELSLDGVLHEAHERKAKTGLVELSMADVLHPEQKYVTELASSADVLKAVRHSVPTSTCYEKAEILGWSADRVVKAVYLHSGKSMFGFVFPEYGLQLDSRRVLPGLLGVSGKTAKYFRGGICPQGMMYGTCTPFVYSGEFEFLQGESQLKGIFVHKDEKLDGKLVDISIGGTDELARKLSVHLPYSEIYGILAKQFGGRIKQADLIERRYSENDKVYDRATLV